MIWSSIIIFFLPDAPPSAWFLNKAEKLISVKRVSGNQTGIKNKYFQQDQAKVALHDPKMVILFISVFAA